jgi:hypothetical protein
MGLQETFSLDNISDKTPINQSEYLFFVLFSSREVICTATCLGISARFVKPVGTDSEMEADRPFA